MKTSLIERGLALLQNWPGMVWGGIVSLVLGGWLIVAKTLRSKLGDWLRYWLAAMLEPMDQWFHTQMARRHTLRAYCRLCLQDIRYQQLQGLRRKRHSCLSCLNCEP